MSSLKEVSLITYLSSTPIGSTFGALKFPALISALQPSSPLLTHSLRRTVDYLKRGRRRRWVVVRKKRAGNRRVADRKVGEGNVVTNASRRAFTIQLQRLTSYWNDLLCFWDGFTYVETNAKSTKQDGHTDV